MEFRTIAAHSGWNQPALIDPFLNHSTETLKDLLAQLYLPAEVDRC